MDLTLEAEDANDWFYKGEGGANVVLGYCGSLPFLVNKVLRIQKLPRDGVLSTSNCEVLSVNERLLWQDVRDLVESTSKDFAVQVYVTQVMGPLLGPEHVDGGICLAVSKQFLESVKKNINRQRPPWRIDATDINTHCSTALLLYDHSTFPNGSLKEDICLSVELKPKCGFLPTSDFIAPNNSIKKRVTRFRMHQFLKLHNGEISKLSEYDPLDLFSGSRDRIHQAVRNLFATPQNNLRVFINGRLIFGGLGGGFNKTEYKADPSFKSTMTAEEQLKVSIQKNSGLSLDSFLQLVTEATFQSGIMDQLLAAQKLDVLDIEGAIHLYYNIISQPCKICNSLSSTGILHPYALLHSLPLEQSLKIVREYLIAATAKDCSLFISIRPREGGEGASNSLYLEAANQNFDYRVNFIDLDLKPLKKMVHYYELDQQIVNFYTKALEIDEKSM